MDADDLVQQVRHHGPRTVIATDFDGTLAPLQADPEQSRPVDGALAALRDLAAAGVQVAVVTGRDAETVVRLGGFDTVPGVVVEGLYGLEQWQDGELTSPEPPPELATLRERLPDILEEAGADPEVWIEDKRLSLVVHVRRTADPAAEFSRLERPVAALAAELGLEAHPGSGVLEVRLPGFDKAGVLDRLVERFRPDALVYLGDDIGDLPAFERVAQLRADGLTAYSVGVLSSDVAEVPTAVDVRVAAATDAVALLRSLAG